MALPFSARLVAVIVRFLGGGGLIFFLIIFFAISFCLSFRMHDLRQGSKPKAACVWRELYVLEGAGFLIGARSE